MAFDERYKIDSKRVQTWRPLLESQGLRRVLQRKRYSKGFEIYPNIVSDAPDTLRFMSKLPDVLSSTFKFTVDETGLVGPNAIAGDFNSLRTVAGHGMHPASIPPVSNAVIRETLKLKNDFTSDRHRKIATALFDAMMSEAAPAKVSIRREASTGSPDYVSDVDKKKNELRFVLEHLDDYLSLVEKGQLLELYIKYNSTIVQTLGERTQADSVSLEGGKWSSKPREVNDELAARTALRDGRRFTADKRVFVDGNEIVGHFAGRRRAVFGMSFVPNYVVAAIYSAYREVYLERYSFTWKHRTPDSILEKMRGFSHMAGFDVKQFDQSVPTFLIDFYCNELPRVMDARMAKLIRLLFSAPYIMPHPGIYGREADPIDPLFGDDPFDIASFNMELGLPSGIACNPDFGKFAMMFQYLVVADQYHGDVLEFGVDNILRGEHSKYAFLNMGDDCVVLTNDPAFHRWVINEEYASDYFAVEREEPIAFLGNVPYKDDRGELQLAPNIASFFVNWLVPEHGINSRLRKNFWAVGDRERRQHYSRAPAYSEAYGIYEDLFQDAFGRTPSSISAEYYDSQRQMASLSYIDALVLQNPSYLQYRFDSADVSPDVLDLLVTSLPADEVWPLISKFIK